MRFTLFTLFTLFLIFTSPFIFAQTVNTNVVAVQNSLELQKAIRELENNTTIKLKPGQYSVVTSIINKTNIAIIAESPGTVTIDNNRITPKWRPIRSDLVECAMDPQLEICEWTPECLCEWEPYYPQNLKEVAIFNIINSRNIHISGLNLSHSSPSHISISDSQAISIEDIAFVGGTYAVHADGESTKDIRISSSTWIQDTSEEHFLWNTFSWEHAHHGDRYFLNGAFFGSVNIAGEVKIFNNRIRDAFNVVRMNFKPEKCTLELCANNINRDVFIVNNVMHRIRDNAVEPEKIANGQWVVTHNLIEAHADISLDNVHNPDQKGLFLIYDNTITKITRPSLYPEEDTIGERTYNWGKVLKLPKKPLVIPLSNGHTETNLPYLNLILQDNFFDVHRESADGQNVKFLKGALPRGTDLSLWGNNMIIGKCKPKLTNDQHTKAEICSALVQTVKLSALVTDLIEQANSLAESQTIPDPI